jgi:hypothetical protein
MKFYKKDLNVSLTDIKLNPRTAKKSFKEYEDEL